MVLPMENFVEALRGWSSQNEDLETKISNFIVMNFSSKYNKLQPFWYPFYFKKGQ